MAGQAEAPDAKPDSGPLARATAYLVLYIGLSSGQIFFNKWVLSSKHVNFPYPLGLTLMHMLFSSVLCFLAVRAFKFVKPQEGMTYDIYVTTVFPIGAMFAMTLWLGNSAYLYISVSFAQMLKAIMPVAVLLLGASVGLEVLSMKMLTTMCLISCGVLVASYGEINFSWVGVMYQLGGVVGESVRLILIEMLLKRKGLNMNPLTMMYYVSPSSALCLFLPWLLLEKPKMESDVQWSFDPLVMSLNALCTFALNVSVFLVILHTSALTIRVAGVVKDFVVVLVSALLFSDTELTFINVAGYCIAILGVGLYNRYRMTEAKVSKQAVTDKGDEHELALLARSPTTDLEIPYVVCKLGCITVTVTAFIWCLQQKLDENKYLHKRDPL